MSTPMFTIDAYQEGQVVGRAQLGDGTMLEVGRQGAGLAIADASLSSRHFNLRVTGGVLAVEDLGSTNGTWLNEMAVVQPVPVAAGGRIFAGNTLFVVTALAAAGYIEGTRWHYAGVPAGMEANPAFGFRGEHSPDFTESVICREDPAPPEISVAAYARRQFDRLLPLAPDLRHVDGQAPPQVLAGEHQISECAYTYEKHPVTQFHAYVRNADAIGIAVWTHRAGFANPAHRFWEILSALRFG